MDSPLYFLPCGFSYLLLLLLLFICLSFLLRLIAAVAYWMSTILVHKVWP